MFFGRSIMDSRAINEQIDNARKTYIDMRVCMQKVINGLPDSPHKSFKYAHYQNLVYKKVFGLNAGALRTKKNVPKTNSVYEQFTVSELYECASVICTICSGLTDGKAYVDIKEKIMES